MSDATVDKAKGEALAARERLLATAQELQTRLEPSRLLNDTVSDIRSRSANLARSAGDVALERPAMVGAAAVAGVLLLARRPLARLGRRIFRRGKATDGGLAS